MEDTVRTSRQQKAHLYYLQNKDRFLENARRYKDSNYESIQDYQADYFQKYKQTAKYQQRQQKRKLWREQHKPVKQSRPIQQEPVNLQAVIQTLQQPVEEPVKEQYDRDFIISFP